ncbi:uncharacterized protein LOC115444322 [Manduca sexta]|nr:uncharacterized protein LOC115444322 [Manduca sexta]
MSKEQKGAWKCPACRSMQPKTSCIDTPLRPPPRCNDNKSTALAPGPDYATSPAYDNVTIRSKTRGTIEPPSCTLHCEETMRALIRQELKDVLSGYIDEHLKEPLQGIKSIGEALQSIKESMEFINHKFEELKTECITNSKKIRDLVVENEGLISTVRTLTARVNQIDQLSRSANLEIQCVPESRSENVFKIVEQLGRTVKCNISENDIQYCSRIAKKTSQSSRPRSILLKLNSTRLRDALLAAVIKYNRSNPTEKLQTRDLGIGGSKSLPVFVSEHLSPEMKSLHAAARQRGRELQYKYVWTRAGRIYMRKEDTSPYIYVKDQETLDRLT